MRILPFESRGVDGLHFFVHFVKDLTIRHHLPGGIDLSYICEVIFCLYLFFALRTISMTSFRNVRYLDHW